MRKALFFNYIDSNQNGVRVSSNTKSGVDWNSIIAVGGLIGLVHVAKHVKNKLAASSEQPQSLAKISPELYGNLLRAMENQDIFKDVTPPAHQELPSPVMQTSPDLPAKSIRLTDLMNDDAIQQILEKIRASDAEENAEVGDDNSAPITPPDSQWLQVIRHPSVILIIGMRGSGKTALGYRLLELLRDRIEPYVVALPSQAQNMLPEWVGLADNIEDVPNNALALIDESHLQFSSRESMRNEGKSIGGLINLSRQKQQTLVFIVQEARQLDVNVVSQADVLIVKEVSDLSRDFERPQLRKYLDKARKELSNLEGDKRDYSWVYAEQTDFQGLMLNQLPSFWSDRLSRAFGRASLSDTPVVRKGKKLPREEIKRKARKLRDAGYSYGKISTNIGVSKTTAYRMVNED